MHRLLFISSFHSPFMFLQQRILLHHQDILYLTGLFSHTMGEIKNNQQDIREGHWL